MTLATICINVARDLGIDEPTPPIYSSRLPAAKRLVAQARRALWSIVRRADWAPLVIEHEFTATGGQSDYDLPPGFQKIINDTVWESSRYWAMRGSLSPQQWQRYRRSIYGRATIWRRWRIRVPSGGDTSTGTKFSIDPMVAATDNTSQFVFEYKSAFAVKKALDGTMTGDWTADDDTSVIADVLIELETRWRVMSRIGLAYAVEKDEADREIDKAVARIGGTMTLNLVPYYREDFIGQYSLAAFPPNPAAPAPHEILPPDVSRIIAPFERPDWQPPPDLTRPPPLAPRPPPMPQLSEEALRARLLELAPPIGVPQAPVRRLRWRHQQARLPGPPPLTAPVLDLAEAAPPPSLGTPYPVPAPTPPASALQPEPPMEAWAAPVDGAPLRPPSPEPQLPPGT